MVVEGIKSMREQIGEDGLLQAEDMANAILYAFAQPQHVSVNEMLVRPTRQTR
jgi:NADP-dependent 3-hydroxy acid dehydrogenase YdfG